MRRPHGPAGTGSRGRSAVAILAISFLFVFFNGCHGATDGGRFEPVLSPNDASDYAMVGAVDLGSASRTVVSLPFELTTDARVLSGNVHQRHGIEFVVVDRAGLVIVSSTGRLLATFTPAEPVLRSAVLVDVDEDGLRDVIVGVDDGADPVLRVINGRGREIRAVRVQVDPRTIGGIVPFAVRDGSVFAIARESWRGGPRGLVRVSLPALELEWFFAVPTGILGARAAGSGFGVSTRTQSNGEYTEFGLEREVRFGFDARSHILLISQDGELLLEQEVEREPHADPLDLWALPLDAERLLVHLGSPDDFVGVARLDSGELRCLVCGGNEIVQIATSADALQTQSVIVVTVESGWTLTRFGDGLQPAMRVQGIGSPPYLLAGVRGDAEGFLVAQSGQLRLLGRTQSDLSPISIVRPVDAVVFEERDRVRIALLADGLEIVSLDRLTHAE